MAKFKTIFDPRTKTKSVVAFTSDDSDTYAAMLTKKEEINAERTNKRTTKDSDGTFEWVNTAGGAMTDCLPVCYNFSKGQTDGDEVEPIWSCTKNNFPGSKCTKSCPNGYKFSNEGSNRWKHTSTKCQKKSWGTSWTESWFKACVKK